MNNVLKNIRTIALVSLLGGFLYPNSTFADSYRLEGYMGVEGGESFHYNLELSDSIQGWLTGYSYTFTDSLHQVKTRLVAQIDGSNRTLNINEQDIVWNNGFRSKATICLVKTLLSFDPKEGKLAGKLITKTNNNAFNCSSGGITLNNTDQIKQLFAGPKETANSQPVATSNSKPKPAVVEDPNKALNESLLAARRAELKKEQEEKAKAAADQIERITTGKDKTFTWHSSQVILEVLDDGEIDGDRISITYNGTRVLSNYVLTQQPKRIILELSGSAANIIKITANNEGSNPPNTAKVQLYDGDTKYEVIAYNKTGQTATILIQKTAQ